MSASGPSAGNQPRVRRNDYSTLQPPGIGEWEPRLSVSMVVPAYGAQEKLDLTLASLAGQTYPAHLLEVVVVDDGTTPPLRLPEIVPANVKLTSRTDGKWGRAAACRHGSEVADGDVVHWLDSDMVVFNDHVEAQLRWHHLADYLVVLGYKRFIDYQPGDLSPQEVYDAVVSGAADKLFDIERSERHEWVEAVIDKTDGLRGHGSKSFGVHVGATASVTADFLRAAGGMDESLVLGEDSELGFRLSQYGAVFIPDPEARSWHLGASTVMRRREQVNRHNEPYLSHRLPTRRLWRRWPGRQWLVPYTDVVIDARGGTYEEVSTTVAATLASVLPDVAVTLLGPWSELTGERRAPLDEPLLDLRLIHAAFANDTRVTFAERVSATSAPAPFRFTCPPGWAPTAGTLKSLVELAGTKDYGLIQLAMPEGSELAVARFERTAAVSRALVLRADGENLDDVIDDTFGSHWIDGTEWALVPVADVEVNTYREDALTWKAEAERWEKEAARLKRKLQQPLGRKLMDAAHSKISRRGR